MSNADSSRKALGRGLSALIPTSRPQSAESAPSLALQLAGLIHVAIDEIDPNPVQPRSSLQTDRLAELAQSIREHGIIQPLIVRSAAGRYQLVAGERRWRAAKMAGLSRVPVIIQEYADNLLMQIALVENIQREDLNPIEVAHAFDRLTREYKLSHGQIAERTGKDRTTVTNMLRLLRLPGDVQLLLVEHRLSMGHARALLSLPTLDLQIQVAERVAAEGLSVRQVERLVQKLTEPREPKSLEQVVPDPNVKAAVEQLERVLGTRVRVVEKSTQRGRIEIDYYSTEDLQRIYEIIVAEK